jgi:hypothetical protein
MLCEKVDGALIANMEVLKLRDGEIGQKFTAFLKRIVLGTDSDGDEVSTLMVDKVEPGAAEGVKAPQGRDGTDVEIVRAEFLKSYDRLADGVPKTIGLDNNSTVLKVSVAAIREDLKDSGFLDATETGAIERVSRNHFLRAKKTY